MDIRDSGTQLKAQKESKNCKEPSVIQRIYHYMNGLYRNMNEKDSDEKHRRTWRINNTVKMTTEL